MKYFFVTIFLSMFLMPVCFSAPNINELTKGVATEGGYETQGVTDTTLSETVGRIIKIILSLTGTIFLVLTVYAGILWMTAGGVEENVTKAKSLLMQAVIGLAIVLSAYSITIFATKLALGAYDRPYYEDEYLWFDMWTTPRE